MKKTIALLAAVCSLAFANAQDQKTVANEPNAPQKNKSEMLAMRNSKHLEKNLGLSAEQTTKVHDALLVRFNGIEAIRAKNQAGTDKKELKEEVKKVRSQYVAAMTGILSADQKTKWNAIRELQKKNEAIRNNGSTSDAPKAASQSLTTDDDGIQDI